MEKCKKFPRWKAENNKRIVSCLWFQLYHVVTGLETLVLLMLDNENKFRPPRLPQECLHGVPPKQCLESDADGTYRCPSSNDIKYRMTRCAIDAIDFYLVESNTALNVWVSKCFLNYWRAPPIMHF